ncbi:hypothetical protein PR048_021321 [Dryococelus australis]|uniref:Uncharacterized protein n=1 Tax=Dryococelus australis TaxID=614101 RepID=A0ABQ9GXX9_9NEOP|nr:hypothetical protein PR048_021321 [Dryococelus australis]
MLPTRERGRWTMGSRRADVSRCSRSCHSGTAKRGVISAGMFAPRALIRGAGLARTQSKIKAIRGGGAYSRGVQECQTQAGPQKKASERAFP